MDCSQSQFNRVDNFVDKFGFCDFPYTEEVHQYRMDLLAEEYQETIGAHITSDPEGVIDGHIDMMVVIIGNLAMMGVDGQRAFNEVMRANMEKEIGKRREGDPNGASIVKPEGWRGPDHSDNLGKLASLYQVEGQTETTSTP